MGVAEWVLITVAVIGASGALVSARYGRMARLEARIANLEGTNNRIWAYVRQQHDHAYRNGIDPLPIPTDLFEKGTD